jgi:hypothetical protein
MQFSVTAQDAAISGICLFGLPVPAPGAFGQPVCPRDPIIVSAANLVTQPYTSFANPTTGVVKQKRATPVICAWRGPLHHYPLIIPQNLRSNPPVPTSAFTDSSDHHKTDRTYVVRVRHPLRTKRKRATINGPFPFVLFLTEQNLISFPQVQNRVTKGANL